MKWPRRPAPQPQSSWVPSTEPFIGDVHSSTESDISHRGGVPWADYPAPPAKHTHYCHTQGWIRFFTFVQRCPCGAINIDHQGWAEERADQRRVEA